MTEALQTKSLHAHLCNAKGILGDHCVSFSSNLESNHREKALQSWTKIMSFAIGQSIW